MQVLAVPVKPLDRAKRRLASLLTPAERAELTLAMLRGVLAATAAQSAWEVWCVSASAAALDLAREGDARPVPDRSGSLLGALREVEAELAARAGPVTLAVLLADLPLITPRALRRALDTPGPVVAAAADTDGGTNLLVRRPASVIPVRFGRSSFAKHRAETYRAGVPFQELRFRELAFDLDRPEDLARLLASGAEGPAADACRELGLADRLRLLSTG